ncbi:putative transcriptional regulatory protein [Ilyonectria robusta]
MVVSYPKATGFSQWHREKSPPDAEQSRPSPRVGDQITSAHAGTSPEENIAIDSRESSLCPPMLPYLPKCRPRPDGENTMASFPLTTTRGLLVGLTNGTRGTGYGGNASSQLAFPGLMNLQLTNRSTSPVLPSFSQPNYPACEA